MRRRSFSIASIVIVLLLSILFVFGIVKLVKLNTDFSKNTGLSLVTIGKLLVDGGAPLKTTDDKVNILLLGMAGGIHDGPDLTDTIIIVSFDTKKHTVSLLSLPRDIWSDALKDKINSAYHYGEVKKAGGGIILARAIMEDVTGLPMHYVVTLDFTQFENLIDVLGGIDVNVTTAFTDTEFPIAGKENDECDGDLTYTCRYETIQFAIGVQHMDGATALKYVRSRHAEGDEGTDFARGRRQQDIILALKEKMMKLQPWFHPSVATKMLQAADTATNTDMTLGEQLTIGKKALQISGSIQKISIEHLLIVPPTWMYGRYVLVPGSDYDTVHAYIQQELLK
ncbi:MAG: LCP family protein [Microgenomates group bacterium]